MPRSDPKTPVEQVVELFVYAPVGLVFEGASLLPQLVEKGRSQVALARMVGRFAVRSRRAGALRAAGQLQEHAAGLLEVLAGALPGLVPTGPARSASAPTPVPVAPDLVVPPAKATAARDTRPGARTPTSLAIPDYDGLSASQVVNRLAGLTPAELDAVRRYEAAKRGRKTILSKVAQLQDA